MKKKSKDSGTSQRKQSRADRGANRNDDGICLVF